MDAFSFSSSPDIFWARSLQLHWAFSIIIITHVYTRICGHSTWSRKSFQSEQLLWLRAVNILQSSWCRVIFKYVMKKSEQPGSELRSLHARIQFALLTTNISFFHHFLKPFQSYGWINVEISKMSSCIRRTHRDTGWWVLKENYLKSTNEAQDLLKV